MTNGYKYGETLFEDLESEVTNLESQAEAQRKVWEEAEEYHTTYEQAILQFWKAPEYGKYGRMSELSAAIAMGTFPGVTLGAYWYYKPEDIKRRMDVAEQWRVYASEQSDILGTTLRKQASLTLLASPIGMSQSTFEGFVAAVNHTTADSLTPGEVDYLRGWWDRLRAGEPSPPPAGVEGVPPLTTEQIIEQMFKTPAPIPVGLDVLTTDEILKSLQLPAMPSVLTTSPDDIRDIFGYENLDEFLDENNEELIKQWEDLDATIKAIKAGYQEAEIPSMTFFEVLKMVLVQPGLAAMDLAIAFQDYWARPWSGMLMANIGGAFQKEKTGFEVITDQARAEGKNWFMSYGAVHEEEEYNWGAMLAAEILLDPTTYIGWGFVSKIVKPVPFIGKYMAATNDAWIRLWDKAFISLKSAVWGKKAIKLPSQKAAEAASAAKQTMRAALVHATGKRTGWTASEIRKVAEDAREFVVKHPDFEHTSEMAKFGSWQLKGRYLEPDDLTDIITKTGADTPTMQNMADISEYYSRVKYPEGAGTYTSREGAHEMARVLGITDNDENITLIKTLIDDKLETELAAAKSVFTGTNPGSIMKRFAVHVDETVLSQLNSPVHKFKTKAGLSTSLAGKVEGFLRWPIVAGLHEQFTVPLAKQYLLFASLGPINAFESVFKGAFRGHNLCKPLFKSTNPTKLAQWTFADLPNAPIDIMDAIVRSEMWMMTEAGESALRADRSGMGRILEHIPGVGKPITKIKPAAFRSLTDWHEYWGEISLRARSWYMVKQYMAELDELAPEAMSVIKKKLPDIHTLGIKGLSKAELDDIAEYIPYAAITGPDALRALKMSPSELFSAKVSRAVDEELAQLANIDDMFKETIKHGMVEEGAVQSAEAIDDMMAKVVSGFKDSEVFKTMWASQMYDDLAKDFAQFVPTDLDQLAGMMRVIDETVIGGTENIHLSRKMTTRRARELAPEARAAFHDANWVRLQRYMDGTENSITKMTAHLRNQVDVLEAGVVKPITGYRAGPMRATIGTSATEGEGLYVSKGKELADFFAGKGPVTDVEFITPRNPIKATETYILDEADIIMKPIKATDDEWLRLNKQAVINSGVTDVDWDVAKLNRELTRLVKDAGYDAVDAGDWWVLMDEALYKKPFKAAKIPTEKATEIRAALDVWETQTKAVHSARSLTRDIFARRTAALKGAKKPAKWWDETYAEWDKVWDEYDSIQAELLSKRYRVSPGKVPPPPKIPDELTPAHVAYILGGTDDTLIASMMRGETHTLKSKVDFVSHVRAKAGVVGERVGKSADEIGFTDEAVSNVYNRLIRSMGVDPNNPIPELTPKFLEYENARLAMHKIRQTSGIPAEDSVKLNRFFDDVADTTSGIPLETRTKAMENARLKYEIDFADYTSQNMADAVMRHIFPFWCVPEYATIMTKSGWKHYSELKIGEDVLTMDTETMESKWEPVEKVESFDYDDDLMVIPAKGKDIEFTPNHRWPVVNSWSGSTKIKRGYELKEVSDLIPRAVPHNFPEDSILNPREAAILGWTVTDGYVRHSEGRKPEMIVYQHRDKYIDSITAATGTMAHPRSVSTDPDNMVIRVSQVDSDRILAICPDKEHLLSIIPQLSEDAAFEMWEAMAMAEGNWDEAYNGRQFFRFLQQPGPVSQAFQMLSVLLGRAITVGSKGDLDMVYITNNRKPYQAKQARRMTTRHYKGKVWCPVTPSGTWLMNCNGSVLWTGNTYEFHRMWWVPRTFLQKPSIAMGIGRYMDYTDEGYIPIPGSDMQINPLRGTIFMGGFRRMYKKDFPEYYDRFPAFSQFWDYLGRAGFYPGPLITGSLMLFGTLTNRRQEWGEIMPQWVKTPLNLFMAAFPESKPTEFLQNVLVPERFREFYIMLELNKRGFDGDVFIAKRRAGIAFTEDEEKAWAAALRTVTAFNAANEQFGLFRLRPPEMKEAYDAAALINEEILGIPVETQDWIRQHSAITNKNLSNYFPLDPLQQDMLYETSGIGDWANMAYPLLPSLQQQEMTWVILFWKQVEETRDKAETEGLKGVPSFSELDDSLIKYWRNQPGGMSPRDWRSRNGDLLAAIGAVIEVLSNTPPFDKVPLTLEARIEYYEKWRVTEPVFHPARELLWYYQELEPEYIRSDNPKYDPDLGEGWDFDTYFAQTRALIESLPPEQQHKFIQMVQRNWTPVFKVWWAVNREYIRPYRMVRQVALDRYTPEEQAIIKQATWAPPEKREELRAVMTEEGRRLVASFDAEVRTGRRNLRLVDPQLDAWLGIWGITTTLLTPQAEEAYRLTIERLVTGVGE